MTPAEARARLAAYARDRDNWLAQTVPTLRAESSWLVGSLATGSGDEWSDLDLIVVGGRPALDGSVLTIEIPANGPADGGYLGAMYEVAGLPLWVDWYLWPLGAAVPREARLLSGTGAPGPHDLNGTLNHLGRGQSTTAPDPDDFALAMLPLAAKHLARGNLDTADAIAGMLGGTGTTLSAVLDGVAGDHPAAELVRRHLELVSALRQPR
ncbi:nucleotidyltransferase domain-containing protein [Kribbella antibiotica]|uniref:Nucleotidyltransferase domain-containing protein n=1 Tax=Kribbella antibiotica TaxID=190195 RepID=A0A4R4ZL31_9ACTN|nr:nucleotidyltransferase domain-containing protein [Kribbella antibiotica]TDD59488.1 nucleotidyltransferase domain-containing protein [Kribbella antibiotica]